MDPSYDYNGTFKSITAKLKKRFMRKPNVSEAIEEYSLLSRKLENEECHSLSGYCLQQIAKSYHFIGNTVSESGALQSAAKQYLTQEIKNSIELGTITFGEDLMSAMSIYDEVIRLHCDNNERFLASKLCLELADILVKFDNFFEAIPYYERAISLSCYLDEVDTTQIVANNTIQTVIIQAKLAAVQVFTCDYMGALNTYSDICNTILKRYVFGECKNTKFNQQQQTQANSKLGTKPDQKDNFLATTDNGDSPQAHCLNLLIEADISRLLLLVYLKPTKLKPEHSYTLEVYSLFQTDPDTTSYLPIVFMERDLFIILQSFIMACQSNDCDLVMQLQTELYPYLNNIQNELTHLISQQFNNSPITDDLFFK